MTANTENVRKALRIRKAANLTEHRDLVEIANRLRKEHVAYPNRNLARTNALTVAIECERAGLLSELSRVCDAIAWFADYEPDIYEMADCLASA